MVKFQITWLRLLLKAKEKNKRGVVCALYLKCMKEQESRQSSVESVAWELIVALRRHGDRALSPEIRRELLQLLHGLSPQSAFPPRKAQK